MDINFLFSFLKKLRIIQVFPLLSLISPKYSSNFKLVLISPNTSHCDMLMYLQNQVL